MSSFVCISETNIVRVSASMVCFSVPGSSVVCVYSALEKTIWQRYSSPSIHKQGKVTLRESPLAVGSRHMTVHICSGTSPQKGVAHATRGAQSAPDFNPGQAMTTS